MAVKVTIEGTGTWVGLKRGVRQAGLLTPRIEERIRRGFVREVERHEIPDVDPAPTMPPAPADEQGSDADQVEQPAPVDTAPEPEPAPAPQSKARRGKTTAADG